MNKRISVPVRSSVHIQRGGGRGCVIEEYGAAGSGMSTEGIVSASVSEMGSVRQGESMRPLLILSVQSSKLNLEKQSTAAKHCTI